MTVAGDGPTISARLVGIHQGAEEIWKGAAEHLSAVLIAFAANDRTASHPFRVLALADNRKIGKGQDRQFDLATSESSVVSRMPRKRGEYLGDEMSDVI